MFLFWLFIALAYGICEEIGLRIDAKMHPYELPDCFKPKNYTNKK